MQQQTIRGPAHLSARVTNMLAVIEAFLESSDASERRDDALLDLVRATQEDAEDLAQLLNCN